MTESTPAGAASPHASQTGLIGASVRRSEDARLITGNGSYVDDILPHGVFYLSFVRSPYPKARIVSIDTDAAKRIDGVEAVLTAKDLEGRLTMPPLAAPGGRNVRNPVLADELVQAVGVPVAAILARTRAIGEDAIAAVKVEYETLPSVAGAEAALEEDAPLLRDELESNLANTVTRQNGDVDAAFAGADHICHQYIVSPRLVAMAMEPRGIVALPEPGNQGLTVWLSTQNPHGARSALASALGLAENSLRVIAPDVGGGFGSKGRVYPEDYLVAYLAHTLGKPVKWVATRSEDFVTTMQGRDQTIRSELALRSDGTILGLKVEIVSNSGFTAGAAGPPMRTVALSPGAYRIPNIRVDLKVAGTNTPPTGPYRGAGRPEAIQNIERLMDQAARELGIDPIEIRRKNFVRPDQFPYTNGVGGEYDSGDYEKALDEALRLSKYDELVQERAEARSRGELVGIGVCTFVEPSGGGHESGMVRVEPGGSISVFTGSSDHGQGHATAFAQLVGQTLRVPMDQIRVQHGDTFAVPQGSGTFGSKSLVLGGGALVVAAERVVEKARRIAAHELGVSLDEVIQEEGGFAVGGVPNQRRTWTQIAGAAHVRTRLPEGMEPGLQEIAFFDGKKEAWGFGAYVVKVRIDKETGVATLETVVAVDDCGVVVNPLIVEGQIHGGLAQGIAEALREHMIFDESGQILVGSLLDYAVPRAGDMPHVMLGETVTPSPLNQLGAKGVGEAATIGIAPAIANAVIDALTPLGIQQVDMPYTAPKLWKLIRDAERRMRTAEPTA